MSITEISEKIFDLKDEENHEYDIINEDTTYDNLSKIIVDFSIPESQRLKALKIFYKKEGGNNTIEVINKLVTIYEMSGTKSLRSYLYSICCENDFEPFLQSIAARALWYYDKKDDFSYRSLFAVYKRFDNNIGTPYKIEFLKMCMHSEKDRELVLKFFINIISDNNLSDKFRFSTIHSLENESIILKLYFMKNSYLSFLENNKNDIRYRILGAQSFLKLSEPEDCKEKVQDILINFANDKTNDYNSRADSLDVILQYGTEQYKNIAKELIYSLGLEDTSKITNIYNNRQNVHIKEIEESVLEALEFLQTFDIMKINGQNISLEYIEKQILNDISLSENHVTLLKSSFNRIMMDKAIYSKYNCGLSCILIKIWTFLSGHKSEKEMKKRLIEELLEMSGTCSSGFASRLVNTISGFADFNFKISWEDQIVANFTGRLNSKIRDMDNLTLQEKILTEMAISSDNYEKRKNFLKFFRKTMCSIREEMYDEFKTYISDTDFDLYFRKAISIYETGSI